MTRILNLVPVLARVGTVMIVIIVTTEEIRSTVTGHHVSDHVIVSTTIDNRTTIDGMAAGMLEGETETTIAPTTALLVAISRTRVTLVNSRR